METAAAVLEDLRSVLDRAAALPPEMLADDDTILDLHRQLSRADAVTTRATASWEAKRSWSDSGAKTAAAWLAWSTRLPQSVCRSRVRLGRALRHMPEAEAAWLAGAIDRTHVSLLAQARTPAAAAEFDRDAEMLVRQATDLRFSQFQRAITYWRHLADAEDAEGHARRQVEDRRFDLSATFGGTWVGNLTLDPVRGTIVSTAHKRIEAELFKADWAEAKARLGHEPKPADLRRTPAQRRADALVEMAIRAHTAPKDGKRPEPLITVLVNYERFAGPICQLANNMVVTPSTVARLLFDDAWAERIVFGPDSRPIDVGHRRRLFTGATRRAVLAAGQECFEDTCETPGEDCQADHIIPWSADGPTTVANGQPACGHHNRWRHRKRGTG